MTWVSQGSSTRAMWLLSPRPTPTRIKKRVNQKHELQIDTPNSKQYASYRNQTICKVSWLDFESIILNEVGRISHIECLESITK